MDATHSKPETAAPLVLSEHYTDAWGRHAADFRYSNPEGWTATGIVTRTRRRGVVVSEIQIHAPTDEDGAPGGISSTALRQVPTGAIIAIGMTELPQYEGPPADLPPAQPKSQPGRQPLSDDLIREVAELYLKETAPGKPRGANTRLAKHFGKPTATISRWVMRARADGWLGPAVPGREGGEPGPRLYIFAEGEQEKQHLSHWADAVARLRGPTSNPVGEDGQTPPGAAETIRPFGDPPE